MTTVTICIVFLVVWITEAIALARTRIQLRDALLIALQSQMETKQVAIAVAQQASEIAAKTTVRHAAAEIKAKLKPFLIDYKSANHYVVLLDFLRQNPGLHTADIESAIDDMLKETTNGG